MTKTKTKTPKTTTQKSADIEYEYLKYLAKKGFIGGETPDWISHDNCHCRNEECPKKDTCRRYKLYLEDKAGYKGWCSYAGFKPDERGECRDYWEWKKED